MLRKAKLNHISELQGMSHAARKVFTALWIGKDWTDLTANVGENEIFIAFIVLIYTMISQAIVCSETIQAENNHQQ